MDYKIFGTGQSYSTPEVSISCLLDFFVASDIRKKSIIRAQKQPSTIKVAPYQTARAAVRSYVKSGYDIGCIDDAVTRLQQRVRPSAWSRNNVANSIEALRHFVELNFPTRFVKIKCSFLKPNSKDCMLFGVIIIVAPDLIMRWEENGRKIIGAVKFRFAKKHLDYSAGVHAASLLAHYLKKSVVEQDETVDLSHCLYVDVMADTIYPAPSDYTQYVGNIGEACTEYGLLWNVA